MKAVDVVLVRTIYPRNIGYVSRAMANMGGGRLILVDPQCELNHEAHQGAAGAQQRLIDSIRYASMDEFLRSEPEGVRFAFCRRSKKSMDHMPFSDRLRQLARSNDPVFQSKIYFFFGPEDDGLNNDELEYMNFIETLPIYGEFKSLNLAHAALLALALYGQVRTDSQSHGETPVATTDVTEQKDAFYFPDQAIKKWLTVLGFEIENRQESAYSTLKRILLKNVATAKELRILEAIVQQTVRKLSSKN